MNTIPNFKTTEENCKEKPRRIIASSSSKLFFKAKDLEEKKLDNSCKEECEEDYKEQYY